MFWMTRGEPIKLERIQWPKYLVIRWNKSHLGENKGSVKLFCQLPFPDSADWNWPAAEYTSKGTQVRKPASPWRAVELRDRGSISFQSKDEFALTFACLLWCGVADLPSVKASWFQVWPSHPALHPHMEVPDGAEQRNGCFIFNRIFFFYIWKEKSKKYIWKRFSDCFKCVSISLLVNTEIVFYYYYELHIVVFCKHSGYSYTHTQGTK